MDLDEGLPWFGHENDLDVLEDFITLSGFGWNVILPRSMPPKMIGDIQAALVSSQLGITLAYARKAYVSEEPEASIPPIHIIFQDIYFAGKNHIKETLSRFNNSSDTPEAGVIFADSALERLIATYFAAGFLFRTGHLYEAHAVLRLFLEQVAWAYSVYKTCSAKEAAAVSPTKSISNLKIILPYVGPFYGLLSERTHLALGAHYQFVDWSGEMSRVVLRHGVRGLAESWTLLLAADCWSVVFEYTQSNYMSTYQNWRKSASGGMSLIAKRPFIVKTTALKNRLTKAVRATQEKE